MNLPVGRRYTRFVLALVAVGLAVAYWNSFTIRFELDDAYVIESNPWIRSLANIHADRF